MTQYISSACLVVLATVVLSAQKQPWVDPAKFSQPPTT